jgi:hypothetical protein
LRGAAGAALARTVVSGAELCGSTIVDVRLEVPDELPVDAERGEDVGCGVADGEDGTDVFASSFFGFSVFVVDGVWPLPASPFAEPMPPPVEPEDDPVSPPEPFPDPAVVPPVPLSATGVVPESAVAVFGLAEAVPAASTRRVAITASIAATRADGRRDTGLLSGDEPQGSVERTDRGLPTARRVTAAGGR